MILKLVRTPGIYLVGFMGSGKTTVGQMLADRLGWEFVDLDEEIEMAQRRSICDLFEIYGEEHFRNLETEAIRARVRMVRAGRPTVVALGGGAFLRPENYELLEDHGVTVWLDCPLDVAAARIGKTINRPLACDPVKFAELYAKRRESYARADYRIDVGSCEPEAAAGAIEKLPIF